MADWINREESWRKRELKEKSKEKSSFGTQGLFGIIKNLYHKISRSKTVTVFHGYQTIKMFEDYQREFELQRSKAIEHFRRRQIRLT